MVQFRWNAASLGALTFLLSASTAYADAIVMPRELVKASRANGCAPIENFYDRPGMINPPYAYGLLTGEPEGSAVFWCKKIERSDRPYLLMIKAANIGALAGCPTKIAWWNDPAGLSIEVRKSLSLKNFRYTAEPARNGPAVIVSLAKVIVNYYDGVSDIFYCHKGQWLFSESH
jgi:hypothetical protein